MMRFASQDGLVLGRSAAEVGRWIGGLPAGGPYTRVRPQIYGPVSDTLVPLRKWQEEIGAIQAPDCNVYLFEDAVTCQGILFSREGFLIKETLLNRQSEQSFIGLTRVGDNFVYSGTVLDRIDHVFEQCVLLRQHWDVNYGHWLVESLPRIAPLLTLIDFEKTMFLVTNANAEMINVYRDSLRLFGVPEGNIKYILGDEVVSAKRIFYPTPITTQPWIKAPLAISVLENIGYRVSGNCDASDIAPRKIFVVRPSSSRRPMTNVSEVAEMFINAGYVRVTPAEMNFQQQVIAFSRASHIAGVLGAELTNTAFAPRGVRILALSPDMMLDDFYWDLVSHKRGAYYSLHGKSLDENLGMNSPFAVDIHELEKVIREFEA